MAWRALPICEFMLCTPVFATRERVLMATHLCVCIDELVPSAIHMCISILVLDICV
jgi:hypothetical protein